MRDIPCRIYWCLLVLYKDQLRPLQQLAVLVEYRICRAPPHYTPAAAFSAAKFGVPRPVTYEVHESQLQKLT